MIVDFWNFDVDAFFFISCTWGWEPFYLYVIVFIFICWNLAVGVEDFFLYMYVLYFFLNYWTWVLRNFFMWWIFLYEVDFIFIWWNLDVGVEASLLYMYTFFSINVSGCWGLFLRDGFIFSWNMERGCGGFLLLHVRGVLFTNRCGCVFLRGDVGDRTSFYLRDRFSFYLKFFARGRGCWRTFSFLFWRVDIFPFNVCTCTWWFSLQINKKYCFNRS